MPRPSAREGVGEHAVVDRQALAQVLVGGGGRRRGARRGGRTARGHARGGQGQGPRRQGRGRRRPGPRHRSRAPSSPRSRSTSSPLAPARSWSCRCARATGCGAAQVLVRVEPDVNQARDLAQVKNAVHETEITLGEAQGQLRAQRRPAHRGPAAPPRPGSRARPGSGAPRPATTPPSRSTRSSRRAASRSRSPGRRAQRLNVTSPMDGVVIRRSVELGDTVTSGGSSFNAGTVLMTVADIGTMIIKAGINEVDIGKVRAGAAGQDLARRLPEGEVRRPASSASRRPRASRRRSRCSTSRSPSTARAPSCAPA